MEREDNFNILKNGVGNLMILIRARLGGVKSPYIVYDGGQEALLYRTENKPIILDYIHPAIREDLKKKKDVLVVETNEGAVIREYISSIQLVPALPNVD